VVDIIEVSDRTRSGLVVAGVAHALPATGAVVGLDDRIFVQIDNRSLATAYIHLFDIGLRGRIQHLNHPVTGIRLEPGKSYIAGVPARSRAAGVGSRLWPPVADHDVELEGLQPPAGTPSLSATFYRMVS
jgi:hypothetical protein